MTAMTLHDLLLLSPQVQARRPPRRRLTRYYLGGEPGWLWRPPRKLPANVGLCVSHRRLIRNNRYYSLSPYPRAAPGVGWFVDSGGFNEIRLHGRYTFQPWEYVWQVRRYDAEIGGLEWAATMDYMCEPDQLARTGKSVHEHLDLTVATFLELRDEWWTRQDVFTGKQRRIPGYRSERSPDLCVFQPGLQGWEFADYVRCIDLYESAGVHLDQYPVVTVGSLCQRSNTAEGVELLRRLHRYVEERYPRHFDPTGWLWPTGVNLHAFGVKTTMLRHVPEVATSADSRAWSKAGQMRGGRCRHRGSGVQWEQNCPDYACEWLQRVLAGAEPEDD